MNWDGTEEHRDVPAWGTTQALCVLLAFLCAQVFFGLVFGFVSGGLARQVLAGTASIAILFPAVFGTVALQSGAPHDVVRQLGLRQPRPGSFRRALWTAGEGVLALIGVTVAMGFVLHYAGRGLESFPIQPIMRTINLQRPGFALAAAGLLATLGAPLSEEILFRSVLYQPIRARVGVIPAALIVSVVFAVLHSYAWGIPHLMVLSLTFTALFERTGSLWYPIAAHGLYNALMFVAARMITLPGGPGAV